MPDSSTTDRSSPESPAATPPTEDVLVADARDGLVRALQQMHARSRRLSINVETWVVELDRRTEGAVTRLLLGRLAKDLPKYPTEDAAQP